MSITAEKLRQQIEEAALTSRDTNIPNNNDPVDDNCEVAATSDDE